MDTEIQPETQHQFLDEGPVPPCSLGMILYQSVINKGSGTTVSCYRTRGFIKGKRHYAVVTAGE